MYFLYFACIIGGDQLTRVRFTGGRKLRAGAHTTKDRLEHTYPDMIELFHTKQAFLTVSSNNKYHKISKGQCDNTVKLLS